MEGRELASLPTNMTVTIEQMEIIMDALLVHYTRQIRKANRHEEKTGSPRTVETTKFLAEIQETLQYVTLMYNIRTKKLNVDVARSGGISLEEDEDEDEEAADSTGESSRQ